MRRCQTEPCVIIIGKRRIYVDSITGRLRCPEIGFGFLGGACSRLMESVLTFDKSQHHKLDFAVPQRSARRPDRVRPRPDRPGRAADAQDRVGRAALDAADPVHDDRVIGHLPDDAEIVGTNRRSWFC